MPVPLPCHVWLGEGDQARPGLLLAWRQTNKHGHRVWEGFVISCWVGAPAHGDYLGVTQAWVDAATIRPVSERPPRKDISRFRPVNWDRPR